MKKMNLSFLGLKVKMVLPLFLLVGLFMFSASTVNAQYVTEEMAQALVEEHLESIPAEVHTLGQVGHALTPAMVDQKIIELRRMFGRSIVSKISHQKSVEYSIEETYKIAAERIPSGMPLLVGHLDAVKAEYVKLLTK